MALLPPVPNPDCITTPASLWQAALRHTVKESDRARDLLREHIREVQDDFARAWSPAEYHDHNRKQWEEIHDLLAPDCVCLLYTSPSPRDS